MLSLQTPALCCITCCPPDRMQPLDPASPLFQACRADSLRRLPLRTQQHELFKTFLQASDSSKGCGACCSLHALCTGSQLRRRSAPSKWQVTVLTVLFAICRAPTKPLTRSRTCCRSRRWVEYDWPCNCSQAVHLWEFQECWLRPEMKAEASPVLSPLAAHWPCRCRSSTQSCSIGARSTGAARLGTASWRGWVQGTSATSAPVHDWGWPLGASINCIDSPNAHGLWVTRSPWFVIKLPLVSLAAGWQPQRGAQPHLPRG